MRSFVTGGGGFAGRHLLAHLRELDSDGRADERRGRPARRRRGGGGDPRGPPGAGLPPRRPALGRPVVAGTEEGAAREHHDDPARTRSVRVEAPEAAIVLASSGEIYGPPEHLPGRGRAAAAAESVPCRKPPATCSAASTPTPTGSTWCARGPSTTPGPDSRRSVVGTLTRQVAEAEAAGRDELVLKTGNPHSKRDFTDVRDVVRAYVGVTELPPAAYNVCSGRSVSVEALVDVLRGCARVAIRHEIDLRESAVTTCRTSAARPGGSRSRPAGNRESRSSRRSRTPSRPGGDASRSPSGAVAPQGAGSPQRRSTATRNPNAMSTAPVVRSSQALTRETISEGRLQIDRS